MSKAQSHKIKKSFSSQSNCISGLVFHILYLTFCVYESNGVENPIHLLLHSLTPPEQGCGKLFSLDKSNGKATGVPNHRVKKHFLAFHSQLLAVACSTFYLIFWRIIMISENRNLCLSVRAGLFCNIIYTLVTRWRNIYVCAETNKVITSTHKISIKVVSAKEKPIFCWQFNDFIACTST